MELKDIYIYRMTHIDNIPHILQNGITHRSSLNTNKNFTSIGDKSLIDARNSKEVNVDNGNIFEASSMITLGDFTPFYFGIRMPMLYVVQNGGNFVERATPAENIIYLACPISRIINKEKVFYFSDGHPTDNLTSFYDKSKIDDLPNIVDWNSIKASFWGGHENLNKKRKKQAEFLIAGDLSVDTIDKFGCFNENAKSKLLEMGVEEPKVKIIPKAYF